MPEPSPRRKTLIAHLGRFDSYTSLIKLKGWFKGKTLPWSLYLAFSCFALGGLLRYQDFLFSHLYAVRMDGVEIGLVREPAEMEKYVESLTGKCSTFYRMGLIPEQNITLTREYRPEEVEDSRGAREALKQRLTFLTHAFMVTVDGTPVVPVSTAEGLDKVVERICLAFVGDDEGVELLDVELLEEIAGEKCMVSPEEVYSSDEIASLLTEPKQSSEILLASRAAIASRFGRYEIESKAAPPVPAVHVRSVEKITIEERISFSTRYTYSDKMYAGESRVVSPGRDGLQEVTYRITRENGVEQSRETVARRVVSEPAEQVVERGTLKRFAWPVAGGGRISQGFHSGHRGVDIAASMNTSILAAESGVVVVSGQGSTQGNYIVINHGSYYTLYLHNNKNLVYVGQRVSRGQTIARMGSTGHSSGPHLHFEIRRSLGSYWGRWYTHPAVNPLQFY